MPPLLLFLFWLGLLLPAATVAETTPVTLEQTLFEELNRARRDPQIYIRQLEQFRTLFQDQYYRKPGSPVRIATREGVAAVDEAIAFLRHQPPLPSLQWSAGLSRAARELVEDQGKTGAFGHGSGKLSMESRINRHGSWTIGYAENVAYGDYRSDGAAEVIVQLLVDDGIPGRGHRLNIFAAEYGLAGVACGPHPRQRMVCAIDFAGGSATGSPKE